MTVDGMVTGAIDGGLLVLAGIGQGDTESELRWMADKLVRLRIFDDEEGRFARSLLDVGGAVLSVSQFTLFGDASKGTRPSFTSAAPPAEAEALWLRFNELVAETGVQVEAGVFGAHMDVELVNDGPVTMQLERAPRA
ncbi:MAG: D-tyrosyl-tRNA(Tyr) deacylase [Thermoleophilia bacterium]|nr:D-tyrosyl-tRNA(Tyr) deacylase [Thermoleophilia bacterium]